MSLTKQHLFSQSGPRDFATTHWSIVLKAQDPNASQAFDALGKLCRAYWYPLYAFVRRQGHSPEESEDLTQEFFSRLMEKNALDSVDRRKGRFRSYLLASMKHLLANEWNRGQRQKRGGGLTILSLDELHAEERYCQEPADKLTPEKVYERRWAETLIDSVTLQLRDEFVAAGQTARFEELKVFLLAGDQPDTYAFAADRLGMTEGAVRTAIYRMRQRYGALFRAEIAQTVTSLSEMEDEIRHFLDVMAW